MFHKVKNDRAHDAGIFKYIDAFQLKVYFYFFYMTVSTLVTVLHACLMPVEARTEVRFPKPEDNDGFTVQHECSEINLDPL